MQARWLKQSSASEVIVVFGGWALGTAPFLHLAGQQDVLFVDDYRETAPLPDLSNYEHRTAVAYSFGVAAFCHWQDQFAQQFHRKIAINGSPSPVDRKLGIPPIIFDKTHDGLTTDSFQQFLGHCYNADQPHLDINVDARKAELAVVKSRGPTSAPQFDKIWISTADRIFPAANLRRAWAAQAANIQELGAPHVPFAHWDSWNEVIK